MEYSRFASVTRFLETDFEMVWLDAGLKDMVKIESESPTLSWEAFEDYAVYSIGDDSCRYRLSPSERLRTDPQGVVYYTHLVFRKNCIVERAIEIEQKFKFSTEKMDMTHISAIGKWLGYPDCCIGEYWKKRRFLRMQEHYDTYASLYNFIRKPSGIDVRTLRFWRMISHIPCDFGCDHTSQYIDRLIRYMNISDSFASDLYDFCSLPVIYSGEFNAVVLNGVYESGTIAYDGCWMSDWNWPGGRISRDVWEITLSSDRITSSSNAIVAEGDRSDRLLINFGPTVFSDLNRAFFEKRKSHMFGAS